MAEEREVASLRTLQANQQVDERWPVTSAMMIIIFVSVALWSLIVAVGSWLIG